MRTPVLLFLEILLLGFSAGAQAQNCQAAFSFGETGLTIAFTDASTSADGDPITSWLWDFEDGATSTLQNPTHTFPSADKYDVCLIVTTQSGCASELCVRIEICVLDVSVNVGECNANNEIPLVVTVNDLFDNARDINISLDGQLLPGSPFDIAIGQPVTVNTTVPGDGLSHNISVQSADIGTCGAAYSFTVPDCSSSCFLSSMSANIAGGATHVVQIGDNFFSPQNTTINIGDIVEFQWVGDGHSTTSDATAGPDSWNSGVIGFGSVYTVNITNPGIHRYYCIPHGGPNGQGMSGMIVANCPSSGQFTLEVSFNTSIAAPEGYSILLDGNLVPGSPFSYSGTGPQSNTFSITGDGAAHTVEIQDVADPTCTVFRTFAAPDCGAAPACSISVSAAQAGGCGAGNQVPAELSINAVNGGASGFNVYIDGNLAPGGPFNYNLSGPALITINVPGDGQSHSIEVQDLADAGCTAATNLVTTDCTAPCLISNLMASTGSSTVHTVNVEDFAFNPRDITITSGDLVEWLWVGTVAHTSTSDATTGPDSWDSGLLSQGDSYQSPVLSTGVHPYYCIPHGGPGGVGMSGTITVQANCTNGQVSVGLSFTAAGGGFNGYEVLVDGNLAGSFAYDASGSNSISVQVVGDGQSHTLTVRDADNPNCLNVITITTPDCNASACQLNLSAQEAGGCDGNGEVAVELTATDIGGGASGFEVLVDGAGVGTYNYSGTGSTLVTINVPGDGQSHTIEVQDLADAGCTASANLTTTDCSLGCMITGLELTAADVGNPIIHIIEVRDFEFVPAQLEVSVGDIVRFEWTGVIAHTSTSDATTGADTWDSGLLNQGGVYEVTITTEGEHPYYCIPHGAPGGVGMSGMIVASPPCDGGNISLSINFEAAGGSSGGFNLFLDGALYPDSPFSYTTGTFNSVVISIPGDGQQHTVRAEDTGDTNCNAEAVFTAPDCMIGTPCALTLQAVVTGGCNEEDQVPVELTVISEGIGNNGFTVWVDGNLYQPQPFNYDPSGSTNVTISVTGTGSNRLIEVQDTDSTACLAAVMINTPLCGPICEIQGLLVNSRQAGKYTVEVRDYEFIPSHIEIIVGDTVEFVWEGAIPHTSTSDVISGPNSWDSGLLGQGASFQVLITEAGLHPYYCIPHGGPGGIGMSGVIEAFEPCDNGSALVEVTFSSTNGSGNGYNVFLDGVYLAGPIPYDNEMGGNSTLVSIPGDSAQHLLTVQDLDVSFCAATVQFTAPDCSGDCSIESLSVSFPESRRHLVEVLDFEFVPRELTVTAGDTVEFFWTGTIPHTTTSDATTGVDTWDSGLLGQGGEFELIINEPGQHPYYCIPHGGPGGIGMSGSITALPACQGDSVLASISFEPIGGGHTFGLLVDGAEIGQYDYQPGGSNTVEVLLFGDGQSHELSIQDMDAPNCSASLSVDVPQCVDACLLQATVVQTGACDENMEVPFELSISGHNEESEGFRILLDGNPYPEGPFTYDAGGVTVASFTLAGDGMSHEVIIEDINNPACFQSFELTLPNCLEPCAGFMPGFSVVYDGMDSLLVQFVDETPGVVHQWLWGFGDGATSNVQNPFHTYSQPGVYTICLLAQDTILGCNQAACEELQIGVTSAGEARTGSLPLRIFPNPAGQNTRQWMVAGLAPSDRSQLIHYVVYGIWGEKKTEGWASGGEVMDIPLDKHLPAGMYLLKLQSSSQTYTGKVAVQ
ncbi:MAG: PKD domain-containing protein [Phaeodactylibacter sp.]|nr:PKD domain-containing protein [Phaeodactylibacter sp.]